MSILSFGSPLVPQILDLSRKPSRLKLTRRPSPKLLTLGRLLKSMLLLTSEGLAHAPAQVWRVLRKGTRELARGFEHRIGFRVSDSVLGCRVWGVGFGG